VPRTGGAQERLHNIAIRNSMKQQTAHGTEGQQVTTPDVITPQPLVEIIEIEENKPVGLLQIASKCRAALQARLKLT